MCSLPCQLARGIYGYLRTGSCAVDVPVLMRACYLTPKDASFSILYVMMTAMANCSLGDDEEEELCVYQGLETLVFRLPVVMLDWYPQLMLSRRLVFSSLLILLLLSMLKEMHL